MERGKLFVLKYIFYGQVDVDITVAIPNGDLWKMNGDEGHVNWVLGQLQKHRRIIKLASDILTLTMFLA